MYDSKNFQSEYNYVIGTQVKKQKITSLSPHSPSPFWFIPLPYPRGWPLYWSSSLLFSYCPYILDSDFMIFYFNIFSIAVKYLICIIISFLLSLCQKRITTRKASYNLWILHKLQNACKDIKNSKMLNFTSTWFLCIMEQVTL